MLTQSKEDALDEGFSFLDTENPTLALSIVQATPPFLMNSNATSSHLQDEANRLLSMVTPKFRTVFGGRLPFEGGESTMGGLCFEVSFLELSFRHLATKSSQLVASKSAGSKRLRRAQSPGHKSISLAHSPSLK